MRAFLYQALWVFSVRASKLSFDLPVGLRRKPRILKPFSQRERCAILGCVFRRHVLLDLLSACTGPPRACRFRCQVHDASLTNASRELELAPLPRVGRPLVLPRLPSTHAYVVLPGFMHFVLVLPHRRPSAYPSWIFRCLARCFSSGLPASVPAKTA